MISSERSGDARFGAEKLVAKSKGAVADQIQMEVLPGQQAIAAQEQENREGAEIEGDFHRH